MLATTGLGTERALAATMSIVKLGIACAVTIPTLALTALPTHAQDRDANDANDANAPKGPALPQVAADSPVGRFGGKGQVAVSSDAGLSISNTSVSGIDGSSTTLILRPAVDYFVMDYLSFGGFLGLEYNSAPGGSSTAFSIGPRLGYNIPLSERFSVWPKIGFSFASTTQKNDATVGPNGQPVPSVSQSNTSVQLNLFAPVMFHPVEHFFIGFGPAFDLDLSGDNKATTIAGRLTLGGWI